MTQLKICGIRPGDNLSFTEDRSVDFIGIVFAQKSRRYVAPIEARFITSSIHESCKSIGVFVNTSVNEVLQTAVAAGLDGVQLHGSETDEDCRRLRESGLTVWKAITAKGHGDLRSLRQAIQKYAPVTDGILLDAPAPDSQTREGVTGGFGVQFDWTLLPSLFQDGELNFLQPLPPVWIAGGLTPENVRELKEFANPFGVDVSSGVEEGGRKSMKRILDMIEAVKQLD